MNRMRNSPISRCDEAIVGSRLVRSEGSSPGWQTFVLIDSFCLCVLFSAVSLIKQFVYTGCTTHNPVRETSRRAGDEGRRFLCFTARMKGGESFWPPESPPLFFFFFFLNPRQTLPTNIPSARTTPGAPQPKEPEPRRTHRSSTSPQNVFSNLGERPS